jgi:hypothetical protein
MADPTGDRIIASWRVAYGSAVLQTGGEEIFVPDALVLVLVFLDGTEERFPLSVENAKRLTEELAVGVAHAESDEAAT